MAITLCLVEFSANVMDRRHWYFIYFIRAGIKANWIFAWLFSSGQSRQCEPTRHQLVVVTSECPAGDHSGSAPRADHHVSPPGHNSRPASPNHHIPRTASTCKCVQLAPELAWLGDKKKNVKLCLNLICVYLCVSSSGAAAAPVHQGWISAVDHSQARPLHGHHRGLLHISAHHHPGAEHFTSGRHVVSRVVRFMIEIEYSPWKLVDFETWS